MKEDSQKRLIKTAAILLIISISFLFIYLAQNILFPIILGFIFSVILLPIVSFLNVKLRFPNILAVLFSLTLFLGIFSLIIFVLSDQISRVFEDIPEIKKNLNIHFTNIQSWIKQQFRVSYKEQTNFIEQTVKSRRINPIDSFQSLGSIGGVFANVILIPIYTFLILIYRKHFVQFFSFFNSKSPKNKIYEILHEINSVIRNYIVGLFIEMILVAFLTGFGLWVIGLKYFFFLGILTAILNLIPYVGIIIACIISILMTLIGTTDLTIVFGIILVNSIVQFIDNNILIPKIVGSKVSINALVSMIGVICGGAIAGVGGMFLALPVLAIFKIIFDRVENLKPFGYLIGDIPASDTSFWLKFKKRKNGVNKRM